MISVVFALLSALSNAIASIQQRRAARTVPEEESFRPALILRLIRDRTWLSGIAALTGGFVFQASALETGALAIVQPVLVTELPFTMLILSRVFHVALGRRVWLSAAAMTGGLALLLLSASPAPGHRFPSPWEWVLATIATAWAVVALVLVARLASGPLRAAVLGVATGICFAFTATLIKRSTAILSEDPTALLVSWQPYAMVAAGLCALFLLQNTLQSGSLVAAQPALTISDPVAGILYGTMMFGETVRTGAWIVPELLGVIMIVLGSLLLTRSVPQDVLPAPAPRKRKRKRR